MKPRDKRDVHLLENFAHPDPNQELSDKEIRQARKLWKRTRAKRQRSKDKQNLRGEWL